jgi:hypothetical protein
MCPAPEQAALLLQLLLLLVLLLLQATRLPTELQLRPSLVAPAIGLLPAVLGQGSDQHSLLLLLLLLLLCRQVGVLLRVPTAHIYWQRCCCCK